MSGRTRYSYYHIWGTGVPVTAAAPPQGWCTHNPFADQDRVPQMGNITQKISDPAWGTWENFIKDPSFDEIAGRRVAGSAYDKNFGNSMVCSRHDTMRKYIFSWPASSRIRVRKDDYDFAALSNNMIFRPEVGEWIIYFWID